LKYGGNNRPLAHRLSAPVTLNHGSRLGGRRNRGLCYFGDGVVRLQNKHWLDYDHIALAVLIMGLGIVILAALSI
jgi:hypothetical protein